MIVNQQVQSESVPFDEQDLDTHLAAEREEMDAQNSANETEPAAEEPEAVEEAEPEAEDGDTGEAEEGEVEPEAEGAGVVKEYVPNTKYKVLDQEKEFDPKLHAILDEETEPLIRELYEKADGLPTIKEKLTATRQDLEKVGGQFNQLVGNVQRIMGHAESEDFDSFFEDAGIPIDKVAKWLMEKARIANLPEEQQALYNERQLLKKRLMSEQASSTESLSRAQQQQTDARIQLLDINLASPDRQPVVTWFDSQNGEGAFKKAVVNYANSVWHAERKDLSPQQAVEDFIKVMGVKPPASATPKPGQAATTKRVVAKPKAKGAIPNFGSGQTSVTAEKKPKNLDELRKYTKQKYG